jgi:surface protein
MNNILLLMSSIFLVAFTNSSFAETSEPCDRTYTLPNNQWQQVSLPCNPGGTGTIAEVFGDDISEAFGATAESASSYGSNWKLFEYDAVNNRYTPLSENDPVKIGAGYWIIQQSGVEAVLDLPAGSSPAPAVHTNGCPSSLGCYETLLATQSGAPGWNMIGWPLGYNQALSAARVKTDSGACANGCELEKAQTEKLVNAVLWVYDGAASSYKKVSHSEGALVAWTGYWLATLENAVGLNPKLLVPVEENAKDCSMARNNAPPITREQLRTMIGNGKDVTQVNTSQITDMSDLLHTTDNPFFWDFNQDISCWDVSNVTDMSLMFSGRGDFDQDISGWNVSKVTNMKGMFSGAQSFNQDISGWDVSKVTNMMQMFYNTYAFNQDINAWDVSQVTNMLGMFNTASFNQDISGWDVSQVTNMEGMFYTALSFNQDISGWDVSKVANMHNMFNTARDFNQNIGSWDVSNVSNMGAMFNDAVSFNQDIGSWNVSNATTMWSMFHKAVSFNQDISAWDVSKVEGMTIMFSGASAFTQRDLSGWNVSKNRWHVSFFKDAGPGNIEPNWP